MFINDLKSEDFPHKYAEDLTMPEIPNKGEISNMNTVLSEIPVISEKFSQHKCQQN
jgi:hypothetical protein